MGPLETGLAQPAKQRMLRHSPAGHGGSTCPFLRAMRMVMAAPKACVFVPARLGHAAK